MAPHHAPYARPVLAALAATTALIAAGCTAHSSPSSATASAPKSAQPPQSASSPRSVPNGEQDETKEAKEKQAGKAGEDGTAGTAGDTARDPGQRAGSVAPQGRGPRPPWCGTERLNISLRSLESGAGQRYAALVVTNSSDAPCRTRGWPGLQLTADGGEKIPTTTARDRSPAPQQFTMLPGDRAWSRLHWTVVPGTGDPADGSCPEPGALRVIPPDERRSLQTDWKLGTVCGDGELEETALRLGSGPAH